MRQAAAAVALLALLVAASARDTQAGPPPQARHAEATLTVLRVFPARAARSAPHRDRDPPTDPPPPSPPPARPPHAEAHRARAATTITARVAMSGGGWACIRQHESGGDYADKRNPTYRGGYQFSYATWASVGGHGDPAAAPPAEQDMRAAMLQARSGWGQWPVTSRVCGLR